MDRELANKLKLLKETITMSGFNRIFEYKIHFLAVLGALSLLIIAVSAFGSAKTVISDNSLTAPSLSSEDGKIELNSQLDANGNDIVSSGTVIWNTSLGMIPSGVVQQSGLDADTLDGVDSSSLVQSRYTNEEAQDAVAAIIASSGAASVSYNDVGNALTISATDSYLPNNPATSNVDMNSKNVTNADHVSANVVEASQGFRLPVGPDAW